MLSPRRQQDPTPDSVDRPLLEDVPRMGHAAVMTEEPMVAAPEEALPSNLERRPPLWRWILAIAVPVVALVYFLRKVDMHGLGVALHRANPALVFAAGAVFLVGCMGASSLRLWLLMRGYPARRPISLGEMTRVYLASSAAHQLLPAPAAEVLRSVSLVRRHGYKVKPVVAMSIVEKLADAVSLGVGLALVWGLATTPSRVSLLVKIAALVGGGALVATAIWLRKRGRITLPVVVCSLVNDGAHALAVGLILYALGVPSTPAEWMIIVGATRVAGAVPVSPGQLGVTEGAVAWTVGLYGVPVDTAIAIALVYRAVRFVPVVSTGLFSWRSLADAA
jgi:uncharacterized membrane protein YbhN (UPF0104 family)